jgi:hypothetical protein
VTTITEGGTVKARGGTGGTITGGRRVGTLRKKWKKGVHQVTSEREEHEEVTKGRQEGRGEGECRGRTTEWRHMWRHTWMNILQREIE